MCVTASPALAGDPSRDEALEILKGLRAKYEDHHRVTIPDETLSIAAKLSERYITDRFLPDKAIDVIDEAGAAQLEVNFVHGDALELADEVLLFKRIVRQVALEHGVYATFMAKPMSDQPASSERRLVSLRWRAVPFSRSSSKTLTPTCQRPASMRP